MLAWVGPGILASPLVLIRDAIAMAAQIHLGGLLPGGHGPDLPAWLLWTVLIMMLHIILSKAHSCAG